MTTRPIIGDPTPPLELIDGDGEPWRLTDQQGSTVVVIFHRHIH
ncbi:MAG: hypothetical protein AAGA90_04225 [Actinomycetota bacterium]